MLTLRDTPGLPDPHLLPPQVAEVGDPFAELRVVHLLARIPRGVPAGSRVSQGRTPPSTSTGQTIGSQAWGEQTYGGKIIADNEIVRKIQGMIRCDSTLST